MTTLQNFGVPLGQGSGRGGILQPKVKYKFRVRVFGFGPIAGGIELTQQVNACGRPNRNYNAVTVHSYNSTGYYAGKAEWAAISLTVRDDVSNSVAMIVGHQEQKQMNAFNQTTPLAGSNYKFQMYIETMAGGDDDVLEQWFLEGCFCESVNYDSFDYASSEPMTIEMSIRYDNATQQGGLMPVSPQLNSGVLM